LPVESPFEHHHDFYRTTGFLTEEYQFECFSFEDDIDTSVVIAGFNQFARIKTSVPRVVIIDNAALRNHIKSYKI